MPVFPAPAQNSRLGFEYFPDTQHYRLEDMQRWLPELQAMGASWVAFQAPLNRAIPEVFLRTFIDSGIEPVLRFNSPIASSPSLSESEMLLSTYARWGIHYSVLFDRDIPHASPRVRDLRAGGPHRSDLIAMCGYVLSTIHFSGVLLPLVHVPWLVWADSGWCATRRASWAAGLAATVGLLAMSGHPLMIIVALLVAGILAAWPSVASGRGMGLLAGGCIGLAGFMATAVVTLPMVLNLGQVWSYKNRTAEGMSYALVSKVDLADALWGMVAWMSYEGDFEGNILGAGLTTQAPSSSSAVSWP